MYFIFVEKFFGSLTTNSSLNIYSKSKPESFLNFICKPKTGSLLSMSSSRFHYYRLKIISSKIERKFYLKTSIQK